MSDLRDYNSSQWWFKELEGIWNADLGSAITHDMKRAAKVAINMVKEVEALHLKNTEAWREDYRIRRWADRYYSLKKQAAGVRFENRAGIFWQSGTWNFGGNKEDYREVPQEPEVNVEWCFVENSLPKGASSDAFDIFRSYAYQVNEEIYGIQDAVKETHVDHKESGVEVQEATKQTIPHAAERALWKAQREAGTNEVWQWAYVDDPKKIWTDIRVDHTPTWQRIFIYRVKPTKLTARICMVGKAYPMSYIGQDWEFTGTREEYRAECHKYGYAILSEIKEVVEKHETVKYYFALIRNKFGAVDSLAASSMISFNRIAEKNSYIIIGDIEEREIEA